MKFPQPFTSSSDLDAREREMQGHGLLIFDGLLELVSYVFINNEGYVNKFHTLYTFVYSAHLFFTRKNNVQAFVTEQKFPSLSPHKSLSRMNSLIAIVAKVHAGSDPTLSIR